MINFVKPTVNAYFASTIEGGLKLAELGGRICYKTEGNITPGSYVNFLKKLINLGHTSVLEHCPLYLKIKDKYFKFDSNEDIKGTIDSIIRSPFSRIRRYDDEVYVYTNLRVIYDTGSDLVLKIIDSTDETINTILKDYNFEWFTPNELDPFVRYSCYITTLRIIVDSLVRERIQSMSVESTRWCNYTKDRFTGTTFCLPHWIDKDIFDRVFKDLLSEYKTEIEIYEYITTQLKLDLLRKLAINKLIKNSCNPKSMEFKCCHFIRNAINNTIDYTEGIELLRLNNEDARDYLPLDLKSEMLYTGYYSDWSIIFDKRVRDKYGRNHPDMKFIAGECEKHINYIRHGKQESSSE